MCSSDLFVVGSTVGGAVGARLLGAAGQGPRGVVWPDPYQQNKHFLLSDGLTLTAQSASIFSILDSPPRSFWHASLLSRQSRQWLVGRYVRGRYVLLPAATIARH